MFDDCFNDLWEAYYAPHLNKRELKRFTKACERKACRLLDEVIAPQMFRPDLGTYMCITDTQKLKGRGPQTSRVLPADTGEVAWRLAPYFSNCLTLVHEDHPDFSSPSLRTAMAPNYVVTIEYDTGGMDFFRQQLGWQLSQKHPLDSPIGQLARHLWQTFADFKGLSVVYSGNKSIHYHFTFSTHLLAKNVPEPTSLRRGLASSWHTVVDMLRSFAPLAVPAELAPDTALQWPEALRRLPLGIRTIEPKADKPEWRQAFGVPFDEYVPQLVMWEHFFDRASGDASVFDQAEFVHTSAFAKASRPGAKVMPNFLDFAALTYAGDKMLEIFPGDDVWPKFAGFVQEQGELRATFFNSVMDSHPASFMSPDHRTVLIQGSNPLWLNNDRDDPSCMPRLRRPLGEMLAIWAEEQATLTGTNTAVHHRQRTCLEQAFADEAKDKDSATNAMAKVLDKLILDDLDTRTVQYLTAPEGISKTRSLIKQTGRYAFNFDKEGLPPLVMYAFATYRAAEEKAAEFNAVYGDAKQWGRTYKAVVVPSFSNLYAKVCADLGIARYTTTDAATNGYASLMTMIHELQPEVIDGFGRYYRRLWRGIGKANPVLFCVHQVAHDWVKNTASRMMFAPSYWNSELDEHARAAKARKDTQLGLLIHDEVSAENLMIALPAPLVDWVAAMRADHPSAWSGGGLAERFRAFISYKTMSPPPTPISFERACELADITSWETVTTRYSGEYGAARPDWIDKEGNQQQDIYAATGGKAWAIHVRDWATHASHRTIVLTTEAVPTAIVRKIGRPWKVTELDTPLIPKDVVETHAWSNVTSPKLAKRVRAEQEKFKADHGRSLLAISNKAKGLVDTATHATAKGSNGYIGQAVVQTMAMMSAEQYEYFEALNAWTGRDDLARLSHIDQYNQSAGRNLGFRFRDGASHRLLINDRLFDCLAEVKGHARYVMQEVQSVRQVRNAKALLKDGDVYKTPMAKLPKLARLRAALMALSPDKYLGAGSASA